MLMPVYVEASQLLLFTLVHSLRKIYATTAYLTPEDV